MSSLFSQSLQNQVGRNTSVSHNTLISLNYSPAAMNVCMCVWKRKSGRKREMLVATLIGKWEGACHLHLSCGILFVGRKSVKWVFERHIIVWILYEVFLHSIVIRLPTLPYKGKTQYCTKCLKSLYSKLDFEWSENNLSQSIFSESVHSFSQTQIQGDYELQHLHGSMIWSKILRPPVKCLYFSCFSFIHTIYYSYYILHCVL